MQELPAQRSVKQLGSTSANYATVCETVVSAVGDYYQRMSKPNDYRLYEDRL